MTDPKNENDEICCGLLRCQIVNEWTYCPYCGGDLLWALSV